MNDRHSEDLPFDSKQEIESLIGWGWVWEGDKLTNPRDKDQWVKYDPATGELTLSPKRAEFFRRLDEEAERAAREARARARRRLGRE